MAQHWPSQCHTLPTQIVIMRQERQPIHSLALRACIFQLPGSYTVNETTTDETIGLSFADGIGVG